MRKNLKKEGVVGLKELRQDMNRYIACVDRGESFTVVRRSHPVFKIAPVESKELWETVVDFTKFRKGGMPIGELIKRLERRS